MFRPIPGRRLAAALLLVFVGLAPALAQEARWRRVTIENRTRDITISYQFRWGAEGAWEHSVTLRAGEVWSHTSDNNGPFRGKPPHIQFGKAAEDSSATTVYQLKARNTNEKDFGLGQGYQFFSPKGGGAQIDLAECSKAQEEAAAEVSLALRELGKRDWKSMIARMSKALAKDPTSAEALALRSATLKNAKGYDAGIWDVTELARLYPGFPGIHERYAELLIGKRQYPRALFELNKELERNPSSVDLLTERAVNYYQMRDFDSCIRDSFRILKLSPKDASANHNLGASYLYKNELRLAVDFFDRTLELEPKSTKTYSYRAAAHALLGNRELAREDREKVAALKGDPEFSPPTEAQKTADLVSTPLGSTVTPEILARSNGLDSGEPVNWESAGKRIPESAKDLIHEEWLRFRTVKFEATIAADLFLRSALKSPQELAAAGMSIEWLYGPCSSPIARQASNDDLGGLRIVGSLKLPNKRFINMIFARGYLPPDPERNTRGGSAFLPGGDNCRLVARLFNTGKVDKDFLFQSFTIEHLGGDRWAMRPGYNLNETTGTLLHEKITESALSGRCMHCHDTGSNLSARLRRPEAQKAALEFYLDIAKTYGASWDSRGKGEKREVELLRDLMTAKGPSVLLPLEKLLQANRKYWSEIWPEFEGPRVPSVATNPPTAWHRILRGGLRNEGSK